MSHHRIGLWLVRVLPFESRASARLRSRLERDGNRRGGLADIEEARRSTWGKDSLREAADFRPRLAAEWSGRGTDLSRRPAVSRRWAMGTAGVLAAVLCGLLILTPRRTAEAGPAVKLRIDSVMIYGQPAQAFIFQTHDADSTFVWVEKRDSGQGEKP